MKKQTKKNNKGFTLVELIVVILIMAILAVALAPQVLRWVNNSRVSADVSTYNTMVSSVQLALADQATYDAAMGAAVDTVITINNTNTTITGDATTSASNELLAQLNTILGNTFTTTTRSRVASASYVITIKAGTATVVQTTAPDGTTVR